jgi:hypothetical protein
MQVLNASNSAIAPAAAQQSAADALGATRSKMTTQVRRCSATASQYDVVLQGRLALAWLALALAGFAAEKQRLADHGGDDGDLERLGY